MMIYKRVSEDELAPMATDAEAVYDELISPLMTRIAAVCREHRIPMLATFEFASKQLCTTTIPFAGMCQAVERAAHVVTHRGVCRDGTVL